jgi:hypothetical protein
MKLFRKILAFLAALILGVPYFFFFPILGILTLAWTGQIENKILDSYCSSFSRFLSFIRGN